MSTYTCAMCEGVFESSNDDDAAEAEYDALFPGYRDANAPRDVVCDDCFNIVRPERPVAFNSFDEPISRGKLIAQVDGLVAELLGAPQYHAELELAFYLDLKANPGVRNLRPHLIQPITLEAFDRAVRRLDSETADG